MGGVQVFLGVYRVLQTEEDEDLSSRGGSSRAGARGPHHDPQHHLHLRRHEQRLVPQPRGGGIAVEGRQYWRGNHSW